MAQLRGLAGHWRDRETTYGRKLNRRWTRRRFIDVAHAWLRYLGHLRKTEEPMCFQSRVDEYCLWAEYERGLTPKTRELFRRNIEQFLRWYGDLGKSIEHTRVNDIDAYLTYACELGWSRSTLRNAVAALRAFFRYGAAQGWCDAHLANTIQGPRIYTLSGLPVGPAWSDVQQIFASLDSCSPKDIRDRGILLLLAVYGLRESEVTGLCLDDIDWEQDVLRVTRLKRGGAMTYPLLPSVGNAILDYLRKVRPASSYRQVFLGLLSPHRPLSRGGIYSVVAPRLKALDLHIPHFGPHSLRHACAGHLVEEGLSLKQIADHLGHRRPGTTRIYTKVDLAGLRDVAAFDLGELS
jgi:site-specific recombinase XerD